MKLCSFAIQRLRSLLLLFALSGLFGLGMSWAQTATGTITRTVTDSGGRVVTDAQNSRPEPGNPPGLQGTESTGRRRHGPPLACRQLRNYDHLTRFQTFHQISATLDVAQRLRIDVALVVGAAAQTVTVTSEDPPLQTEESPSAT